MSEQSGKTKPIEVIDRTVKTMKAFGYVDRGFILAAFEDFLREQPKTEAEKRRGKGFWAGLGKLMFGWMRGEIAPHERRDPKGLPVARPGLFTSREHNSIRLLKELLAHVPAKKTLTGGSASRHKPVPVAALGERHEDRDVKLVAKFFRTSGLAETGFPVRLVGRESAEAAGAAPGKGDVSRASALSALTGGLLYRFAYDHEDQLKWDDAGKVFRSNGIYRLFVCPPGQSFVEQRLVLIHLDRDETIIRAAEIRKRKSGYALRGGFVVPASGVNTLILSSDFSEDTIGAVVEAELDAEHRQLLLPEGAPEVRQQSAFLQEHQLGFYTLLNRGGGEVRGSVLDGPAPGGVAGYKIDRSELGALADLPLGLLNDGDIDRLELRDRVLIAQTAAHGPTLSIEVG